MRGERGMKVEFEGVGYGRALGKIRMTGWEWEGEETSERQLVISVIDC